MPFIGAVTNKARRWEQGITRVAGAGSRKANFFWELGIFKGWGGGSCPNWITVGKGGGVLTTQKTGPPLVLRTELDKE